MRPEKANVLSSEEALSGAGRKIRLAALAQSFERVPAPGTGGSRCNLAPEGSGREEIASGEGPLEDEGASDRGFTDPPARGHRIRQRGPARNETL